MLISKYISTVSNSKIKNVTFGIFNIYHKGHEDLFKRMGYNRIVGVADDSKYLPFDYRIRAISTSNMEDLVVVEESNFKKFIGELEGEIRLFIDESNYLYCKGIIDEINKDIEIIVPKKSTTKSCNYLKEIHPECGGDVKKFYEKGREYLSSYEMAQFAFRAIELLWK